MIHNQLQQFYSDQGFVPGQFWIGPEHPEIENFAIDLLAQNSSKHVLEIGYQAGGFAVPVILAFRDDPLFAYTGIDNLSYSNAVSGTIIRQFLIDQGADPTRFTFLVGDSADFLLYMRRQFDLILVDHLKRLYPHDLQIILAHDLLAPNGTLLFHDVETHAAKAWPECSAILHRMGYSWKIHSEIRNGLAVARHQNDTKASKTWRSYYQNRIVIRHAMRKTLIKYMRILMRNI